jgi:hypothetical protein
MENKKVAIIAYIIISIGVIIALAVMLAKRRKCKEGFNKPILTPNVKAMIVANLADDDSKEVLDLALINGFRKCVCSSKQGGRQDTCQNGDVAQWAYDKNIVTEYTQLKPQEWSTTSPGDMDFPNSDGCPWPNKVSPAANWPKWDFTDFGSA